jgi:AbiV family abortive infection protein
MGDSSEEWWSSVEDALAVGKRITISKEQLNQACDHIVRLLSDASVLLEQGSHATSVFLSITALEETAKVHIGKYRRSLMAVARGKDPLFRHDEKHKIAAAPTVAMGHRLQEAIGKTRVDELVELSRNGGLVRLRESSLYIEQNGANLNIPADVVSISLARDLLLFSIEAFDDALVGYTHHTDFLAKKTDALFARWSQSQSDCV